MLDVQLIYMFITLGPIEPTPSYTKPTTIIHSSQYFDMWQFTKGLKSRYAGSGELSALIIEDGRNSRVVPVKYKECAEPLNLYSRNNPSGTSFGKSYAINDISILAHIERTNR